MTNFFKIINKDFDCIISQKTLNGRITPKRYKTIQRYIRKKTKKFHCSCEHDCCGCLSRVRIYSEYSHNKVVLTKHEYLNY